jgi:hypothetical protein
MTLAKGEANFRNGELQSLPLFHEINQGNCISESRINMRIPRETAISAPALFAIQRVFSLEQAQRSICLGQLYLLVKMCSHANSNRPE